MSTPTRAHDHHEDEGEANGLLAHGAQNEQASNKQEVVIAGLSDVDPVSSSSGCRHGASAAGKRARRLLADGLSRVSSASFWLARLPCLGFARNYNLDCLVGDLIAGVTTALTVIPQGIGYAPLAGLPLQFGLYASLMPGFVYALFGSSREVTIGPTAVNALMSFSYAGATVTHALTLAFFCGIIEMAAGIFNLGFLVNFISAPVISAFTSAVSIQVATSMVKGLLGLQVPGRGFVETWVSVFRYIDQVRPVDAAVGFACIGVLLFLKKFKDVRWCEGRDPEAVRARVLRKAKWFVAVSSNCLAVIVSSVVAYALVKIYNMKDVLILTGDIESGLPGLQVPWQFRMSNETQAPEESPIEIAESLGIGLAMLPLVSMLQHIAIVKFYAPIGKPVPASQEMFALGACQLAGSFVGSISVTASFGRSAVNAASGVRTPFGGIVTGAIIILACTFLTPYFAFIPTAALSAVVISAMIFTIDVEILLPLWKAKKLDLIPYTLTLLLGLFWKVEIGILVGSVAHLCMLIYFSSKPNIAIHNAKVDNIDYLLVVPDRGLFFPSVDEISSRLSEASSRAAASDAKEPLPVIVDMSMVVEMDYTAAVGIRSMAKQLKKCGQSVYFCSVQTSVEDVLQGVDSALFLAYVNVHDAEQKIRAS